MIIKTKKIQLSHKHYIKFALKNILIEQKWIIFFYFLAVIILSILFNSLLTLSISILLFSLYLGFWLLQFYGVTMMDQSKLIFEKVNYEINSRQILIYLSTKQGIPIEWKNVKKVWVKNTYFLIFISKAHLIYMPYSIFSSDNAVSFVKSIIKRKRLIK